ncbi:MAG: flavodoxin family protein [Caldiserica bacterium]|nr:flavodoxin family protein [Caldisericota bacterium]
MIRAVAINGSPQMEKGNTALVLASFIQGMTDAGSEVELLYASRLKVKPCSCGVMYCWNDGPGECCIQDDMQLLYPKLKAADVLILATPVYVPLPGDMQNVVNRLMPLIDPKLETRQGRTRARLHEDVNIQKIVLVATSGWREVENCDTVVRVVRELAEDASVEFAGAVLRPHSDAMKVDDKITEDGEAVLDAVRRAGSELVGQGRMSQETLKMISRPLF